MKTGLRTEIVVSITLLLGAALLFAGFLLLKLTEQELLDQQRQHARTTVALLSEALAVPTGTSSGPQALTVIPLDLLDGLPEIVGWRLLDTQLQTLSSLTTGDLAGFDLPTALLAPGEILESLSYSSAWLLSTGTLNNYLDLTTTLLDQGEVNALLQVRYSLKPLTQRVHRAQRLLLIYVLIYGLVLTLFGIFLLNRNVVQPIRRLQQATAEVASGHLKKVDVERGPGELSDLSQSFNRMVTALEQSRVETESHIASLETANMALSQARDELVRSEKMASVGHLAAGMAHEIGNPLGALIGYLGVLQTDLQDDESLDLLKRAQHETSRIDKLIRELLDYAAPGTGEVERISPVTSLRETVELLSSQGLFDEVTVEDRMDASDALVAMDPQRLQQVWVNLLLNAGDAMGGKGRIVLTAEQGRKVDITITDQGGGFTKGVAEKIFEPFYTTKDPGKGRGLGLAVCQRIVEEAGGRITVTSTDAGASFTVSLPRVTEEA